MFVDSAVGQDLNVTLTRGEIGSNDFAELSLFLPFSRFSLRSRSVAGALPTLGVSPSHVFRMFSDLTLDDDDKIAGESQLDRNFFILCQRQP